jgi:hypothetical protein
VTSGDRSTHQRSVSANGSQAAGSNLLDDGLNLGNSLAQRRRLVLGLLGVLIVGGHSDGSGVDETEGSDTGSVKSLGRTECSSDKHRFLLKGRL